MTDGELGPNGGDRPPERRRANAPVSRRTSHRVATDRGETDVPASLVAAEEALEKARQEARENAEKHVRALAELDNLRKRHRQEQAERLQYANAELITRLLPVVDNFHRALEHAPEAGGGAAPQEWVAGLTMVLRQLEDLLEAEGVKPIEAVGEDFDPSLHQAVMAEPSQEHEEGKVIAEMRKGYTLHDRVLRPSMVKVARNS